MPAILQGTVFDPEGHKVKDATVKLFTAANLNPVDHVKTDPNGRYSFTIVLPGTYAVTAAQESLFSTPPVQIFSVGTVETLTIDITLPSFPSGLNRNGIYGKVRNFATNTPIENAQVTINNVTTNPPVFFTVTLTNTDGQYLVDNLPPGTYSLQASANGFNASEVITIPISANSLVAANVPLTINAVDTFGTVSGTITDKTTGLPLNNASVGLYRVNADGSETLLNITRTQSNGLYLFTNVQPGNTYLVKAKLAQP